MSESSDAAGGAPDQSETASCLWSGRQHGECEARSNDIRSSSGLEEPKRPGDEILVVLEDRCVAGIRVEGDKFALG